MNPINNYYTGDFAYSLGYWFGYFLVILFVAWFAFRTVKKSGYSGWYGLFIFIPIAGWIMIIYWGLKKKWKVNEELEYQKKYTKILEREAKILFRMQKMGNKDFDDDIIEDVWSGRLDRFKAETKEMKYE